MNPYHADLENATQQNTDYRRVIFTGKHMQLVLMSIPPKTEIGLETHAGHDQFIRVEDGEGVAIISGQEYKLEDDMAVIIPAGHEHNIVNTSESEDLKLYTIYSPPEHEDGLVEKSKSEAE